MSDPADRLVELRNTLAVYEREYQEKTIKLMSHYSKITITTIIIHLVI
jgi:hypothetical protein